MYLKCFLYSLIGSTFVILIHSCGISFFSYRFFIVYVFFVTV